MLLQRQPVFWPEIWHHPFAPGHNGNLGERFRLPVAEVTIQQVDTVDGPKWRVCGLGYCVEHGQRWQAEVLFECLKVSKGLESTISDDRPT